MRWFLAGAAAGAVLAGGVVAFAGAPPNILIGCVTVCRSPDARGYNCSTGCGERDGDGGVVRVVPFQLSSSSAAQCIADLHAVCTGGRAAPGRGSTDL